MSTEPSQPAPASRRVGLAALLEAMRIPHWIKNSFVAAPLLFSGRYVYPAAWVNTLLAVASLSLLSSAIYLINDVCDRRGDREHPTKRNRPVASGRLGVGWALLAAGLLLPVGLALAAWVHWRPVDGEQLLGGWGLLLWASAYFAMNLLYSLWLKRVFILDVLLIAAGFVLRAMAGAAAIAAPISPWLVVCTFTLCLFLAVAKRRGEVETLGENLSSAAREVNRNYHLRDLEHMLTVCSSLAILTYSLYCLAPGTVHRIGSAHLVWTIPLVIYGLFRYQRVARSVGRGDPSAVLFRDRVMWIVLGMYVLLAWAVLQYGRTPMLRDLLDSRLLLE